jgi:hypothetical protein
MTKTLKPEDWERIHKSFTKRDEVHPNYMRNLESADEYVGLIYPRTFITIEGIKSQIDRLEVGSLIFYMEYDTPDGNPLLEKCEIIEE